MEIPVLVHGKGIYDSDDMKMKYTGMILEGSRIKEMGSFEELGPAYPGARVMDFQTAISCRGWSIPTYIWSLRPAGTPMASTGGRTGKPVWPGPWSTPGPFCAQASQRSGTQEAPWS